MGASGVPRIRPGEETTGSGDPSHAVPDGPEPPETTGSGDPRHIRPGQVDEEE
ncbi:hypothetical protein EC912_10676 [Luteibacter rhizovicinus]|uniref:Uncharacterized protein n=1 Tax=Luteibacter rhizovicinus TaxID=242606 RepID=A0A4R3YML3_9GAMM|nr:hypothetical protein EC912_10676 [Luteibacter rhizovicinus]